MADQFQFLLQFYWNPRRAAGSVLDCGSFVFGLIAALAVTLALSVAASKVQAVETGAVVHGQVSGAAADDQDEALEEPALSPAPGSVQARKVQEMMRMRAAAESVSRHYFGTSLQALMVMAVVFVPVSILILAGWDHLGGGMTILFRDFMPVLSGLLFAWAASQLPFAVAWTLGGAHLAGTPGIVLECVAMLLFALFASFVLSTVMGVSLGHGATAGVVSAAACFGASYVFAASSGILYMFASPWMLYMAYLLFGRDVRSLGGGLNQRQNFKRQLEAATLNPRDGDAHYQLGLIYVQRRSFEEAEASFRRALEINPNDPDVLFQLGKLLRQQPGKEKEALDLLERAVKIDPNLSNHEIWRELGALALQSGRPDVALPQLEHYISYREYDPEGLVLLGQALRAANRWAEAKAAFEKAIEAVRTAPPFRRHALKRWQSVASQELRKSG